MGKLVTYFCPKCAVYVKDNVTACIPSTSINHLAVLPCPPLQYNGKFFDTKCKIEKCISQTNLLISDNITKLCLPNATWHTFTNYTECLDHPLDMGEAGFKEWEIIIFLVGYSASIISLLVAIFIFLYFR